MKRIALAGSTGSIGRQAINVALRYPDRFRIVALCAEQNGELLLKQAHLLHPTYCAIKNEEIGKKIASQMPTDVAFFYGEEACHALAALPYADTLLVAVSGFAGLKFVLDGIVNQKSIALANKESLVAGGSLVMPLAKKHGVEIAPVDSEHSAIWQCLNYNRDASYERILLTASGGPFRTYTKEQLKSVTVAETLKHPTWNMGAKITVDSATLLNKGFEVIEAMHLYNAPLSKIEVLVHPESIVHSLVSFADGSVLAQMGYPSMELPIQLALTYPERIPSGVKPLDLASIGSLHFYPVDPKFRCFSLSLECARVGGTAPCILNAAGEEAVRAFLTKHIRFDRIAEIIDETLQSVAVLPVEDYQGLLAADQLARNVANSIIQRTESV